MSDNIPINPSKAQNALPVATDDVAGVHYPIYKQGYGPEGQVPTQVDLDNPLPILQQQPRDFYFEVSRGNIPGLSGTHVVAHSSTISTSLQTVWEEPYLYTYSATADINTLSSSDVADTQELVVIGLDANHNEVVQTVTLNGQTPVTLTTPLMRFNLMYNDNGVSLQGDVYLWVSGGGATLGVPDVGADIRGRIIIMPISGISHEISAGSVFTVPAGKQAYVVFGKTSATDTKAIELTFWVRLPGKVFRMVHHVDFKNINYDYFFKLPALIPEKADLEVRAVIDAGTGQVNANYDLILEDIA